MATEVDDWDLPYPCEVVTLNPDDDDEWDSLLFELGREKTRRREVYGDRPLARCLEVARSNMARSLVIETRYVDLDYRSEYSAFYSKAFEPFHDACRRLHFFATELDAEEVTRLSPENRESYLGYVVLRPPQVKAAVGRTMLRPPQRDIGNAVRTAVREDVFFFGQKLTVRAVPFMQQDARLGTCAHVAIWMAHYSAVRADHRVARQPIAEFSLSTDPSLGLGRVTPSPGLTLHQMSDVLERTGLSPIYYECAHLTDDDLVENRRSSRAQRVTRVCCRYLNSGLPVIAVVSHVKSRSRLARKFVDSPLHAIVVCGYFRSGDEVLFVAHDDRRGPYLTYKSVMDDYDEAWQEACRWDHVLAPVPQKLWLTGEAAERSGAEYLIEAARVAVRAGVEPAQDVLSRHAAGKLRFRTFAITGNRFKRRVGEAITDPGVLRTYREARLPRYIWCVEAIDIDANSKDEPECVLAEVIYDATSDARSPRILATRLPGVIYVDRPDIPDWHLKTGLSGLRESFGQDSP